MPEYKVELTAIVVILTDCTDQAEIALRNAPEIIMETQSAVDCGPALLWTLVSVRHAAAEISRVFTLLI